MLTERFDDLMKACGGIRTKLEAAGHARELRAPKHAEGEGHPFMRPVVQKAVARVASEILLQGVIGWPEVMNRLSQLNWRMASPPWTSVFSAEGGKMLTGKDNTQVLADLLHAHLAPASKQSITRVLRNFKNVRGEKYPIPEEELAKRVPIQEPPPVTPIEVPEVSSDTPEAAPPPATEGEGAAAKPGGE